MTTKTTNGNYKFPGFPKWTDLTGQTFNRLTVEKLDPNSKKGGWWICHCRCGVFGSYPGAALKKGHAVSCGCLLKDLGKRQIVNTKQLAQLP